MRLPTVFATLALASACGTPVNKIMPGFPLASDPTVVESVAPKLETRYSNLDTDDLSYAAVTGIDVSGELRADSPSEYTVVRGDTLWGLSGRFLRSPWKWNELWKQNPSIENPHLIYPGDRISVGMVNGVPSLSLSRGGAVIGAMATTAGVDGGTVRLSPEIRTESLDEAIPTISGSSIQQFLHYPEIVDIGTLDNAPYVIGNSDERLTSAAGHDIYVKGRLRRGQNQYGIFRQLGMLTDPITGESLGYEVEHVADATVRAAGNPATLLITNNSKETMIGDYLLPLPQNQILHNYIPRAPALSGEGRIVGLVDAISQSGQNQVVILNLGDRSGVQVGDILAVKRNVGPIVDPRSAGNLVSVDVPAVRNGIVMVFKTFEKVSYALVMESARPINNRDIVDSL